METDNNVLENRPAEPVEEPVYQEPVTEPAYQEPVPEPAPQGPVAEPAAPEAPVGEPGKKGNFFVRASGGWTDFFLIAAVLSVLIVLMGELARVIFVKEVFSFYDWALATFKNENAAYFLDMYFSTIGAWVGFVLVITIFSRNRPMWKAFFYNGHGNNIRSIFIGILLGGGMNGACVFMSWLRGDINLTYNEFNPALFFAFLFCVMIQSGSEEIIDRCYLYQKLRRRYRWPIVAVAVNALVFMALHMGNPGVTKLGLLQVFEIGVLFSLIVYYYDSLWTAIWAHTAWNFSQSIVFGLPNSGIVSQYSVFKLDAANARDGLFYNTSFGVEGSPGACVLIAVVCVLVLIAGLVGGGGERVDYWKQMEEDAEKSKPKSKPWEWIIWAVIVIGLFAVIAIPQLGELDQLIGASAGLTGLFATPKM